jgi:hypothetical protein
MQRTPMLGESRRIKDDQIILIIMLVKVFKSIVAVSQGN